MTEKGSYVRLKNTPRDVTDYDFEFGLYRKTTMTKAVKVLQPFSVYTDDGMITGAKGDYLCEGIEGERWPMKASIFEATYEPMEAEDGGN